MKKTEIIKGLKLTKTIEFNIIYFNLSDQSVNNVLELDILYSLS